MIITFATRSLVFALIVSLIFCQPISYAQQVTVLGLPRPGTMVDLSPAYAPVLIKGLKIHQDNPLAMDFIVDTGNTGLQLDQAGDKQKLNNESEKLIKYFLAALTLPEKEVWVNLSPYEKDRIIPKALGQTEMGRDMLAEDYILKQITASLIYPEKRLGRDFWSKVYSQAYERFGTTQVPVNTFNKVWIVADKATVYENKDTAFVVNSHLKVMLEEDYLSLQKHVPIRTTQDTNGLGSQIVRAIILPALEKEVNQGKNFANLRQIFHSLILAKWYKQALKQALINQVYSNKNKVAGVDVRDKAITAKIYAQYLRAYKKGVFNFIKEDVDQATQQTLPRKYFSGGVLGDVAMTVTHRLEDAAQVAPQGRFLLVEDVMGKTTVAAASNGSAQAALGSYLEGRGFSIPNDDESAFDRNSTVGASVTDVVLLRDYAQRSEAKEDAAMVLQPATVWERKSNRENVYNVLSGTNATVVLTEAERAAATTINVAHFDQTVEEAREYLSSQHLGDLYSGTIQVKLLPRDLKYGYAIDHDTKTIYLSPNFYLKLRQQNVAENFDFLVRKSIFLLLNDPQLGQKYEYEFAYGEYKQRVIALFPDQSEPKQLLSKIEEGILLNGIDYRNPSVAYPSLAYDILPTSTEQVHFVPMANKERVYGTVRDGNIAVIEAGESVRRSNEEVFERATDAMYVIGINALDGIADYRQGAALSTAQFSSKFNPITIAHSFITILYTYAISGASSYGVNVSEFDPRKPDIQESYKARLALAGAEIQSFFHRLVNIIPGTDEIKIWNGEEVAIIRASKIPAPADSTKKYLYLYTAGGDHHYVWAPFNAGTNALPDLIGFDEINDTTRKYYSFYAGIDEGQKYGLTWQAYQGLVQKQKDRENQSGAGERKFYDLKMQLTEEQKKNATLNMEKRKAVVEKILAAKSAEDMQEVFRTATILPRLDTAGKMYLARKALPHIDFVLAHTIRRGENFGDKLRDELITANELKVFNVDGLNAAVAATNTREGLIAFLFGIVNFNLLYGASKPTLKKIFDPQDREPLQTLLRQSALILPKSIPNMLRDNEAEHQRLFRGLQDNFTDLLNGLQVEETTTSFTMDNQDRISDRGKSIITLKKGDQIVLQIDYQIVNTVDREGRFINKLDYEVVQNNVNNGINGADAEKSILDYIRKYNDVRDSAMAKPAESTFVNNAVNPGGIDFNTNQMQLNVQKQGSGVGINFDPAMLKRFESGDFQGFMPIIINILPITNIAPMLGLNQEDTELSKA